MNHQNVNRQTVSFVRKAKTLRHIKQNIHLLVILLSTSLLSACQLTPPSSDDTVAVVKPIEHISYSQYYLWLKTLNDQDVLAEEQIQKALISDQNPEKNTPIQSKLILIYSLPTTPLHRPYKAKRLLNEHLILNHHMSRDNLAFTMLLRDQLNTQLHLLEKQNTTDKECNKQLDQHHALIEKLQSQVDQVNKQLTLLKRIDRTINERG